MPQVSSKEMLSNLESLEANLRLQRQGASQQENDKATAIELFRRASSLEDAIAQLKLPYTYDITIKDHSKVEARKMMCGMSVEVLEAMRDELITAGVNAWMDYTVARNSAKKEA